MIFFILKKLKGLIILNFHRVKSNYFLCKSISIAFCIEPVRMTFPPLTKNIASAFLIVLSRWAIITLVVVFGSFERMVSRSSSVTVSILAVASSRMRSSGFLRKARIKAMSCFCPRLIDSVLVTISVLSHCPKSLSRLERPYSSSRVRSSASGISWYALFP